jgi:hypothetical protein
MSSYLQVSINLGLVAMFLSLNDLYVRPIWRCIAQKVIGLEQELDIPHRFKIGVLNCLCL